jgi:non-ribosomal peptide synthetase component F
LDASGAAQTAAKLGAYFSRVFEQLLSHHDATLENLQVVPQDELNRITAWQQVSGEAIEAKTLAELFKRNVQLDPQKMALISETAGSGAQYSYQQLDTRTTQLAHYMALLISEESAAQGERIGIVVQQPQYAIQAMLAAH